MKKRLSLLLVLTLLIGLSEGVALGEKKKSLVSLPTNMPEKVSGLLSNQRDGDEGRYVCNQRDRLRWERADNSRDATA